MKHYFHYASAYPDGTNEVKLLYHISKKWSQGKDALDFDAARKVLDMFKISYGLDLFENSGGRTHYIYLKTGDFKKISKLLFNYNIQL